LQDLSRVFFKFLKFLQFFNKKDEKNIFVRLNTLQISYFKVKISQIS